MGHQTSKEWSILLKSAVLSMNSTKKRSTGHTPFKVMLGRKSRYEILLPVINLKTIFLNQKVFDVLIRKTLNRFISIFRPSNISIH